MPERVAKIVELAKRIEADIRQKDLRPGDHYLSTVDTARMSRVDTTDANRALQFLTKRELPAVVFGSLYPSVEGLPFVDRDQRRIGRLLAEHLLARGHKRILLLARQRMLPGDYLAIDAVRDTMDAAGLLAGRSVLLFYEGGEKHRYGSIRVARFNLDWLEGP